MTTFDFIDDQLGRIDEIATAGYFLALRIRGASPLMSFHSYPQVWVDEYTQNGYMLRDPITTWGMTIGGSIRWSSPLLLDPFRIFRKAAAHGLKYGASVAHGPVGHLTICSFSRSDREMTDAEIARVKELIVELHERTALPTVLTDAQKAVLGAISDGGTGGAAVATKLGLQKAAAAKAVTQICDELMARSPHEAVQRARDYRLL